jgi:hypothetical protein
MSFLKTAGLTACHSRICAGDSLDMGAGTLNEAP